VFVFVCVHVCGCGWVGAHVCVCVCVCVCAVCDTVYHDYTVSQSKQFYYSSEPEKIMHNDDTTSGR